MKQMLVIIGVIGAAWSINKTEQHFLKNEKYEKVKTAFQQFEDMVYPKAEVFPSKQLVEFIKLKEGFRSNVYVCSGGKRTIGYGFTSDDIYESVKRGYLPKGYRFPASMTREEAENFLIHISLPVYNEIVEERINVSLTPNQKEALISFTYNLGGGCLENLAGQLNKGDYNVTERMKRYVYAGGQVRKGLVQRRNEEAEMFNN